MSAVQKYRVGKKPSTKGRSARSQRWMTIPHPLSIDSLALTHSVKMRFTSKQTITLAVAWNNLLDTYLIATTASQGYQLFDMVKIRKVEMWSYSPSGNTTCSVSFIGKTLGTVGDGAVHTDTGIGVEPAYLCAVPSSRCTASDFVPYTTATAFNMYCPTGTIIDLHLTFRNGQEGGAPQTCAQALSAAQPGNVYVRSFDGAPTASSQFTPLGTPDIQ